MKLIKHKITVEEILLVIILLAGAWAKYQAEADIKAAYVFCEGSAPQGR